MSDADQMREGLEAAVRAAKLALFVIRKQGVMPNSSWESGLNGDLKTAEDALAHAGSEVRRAHKVMTPEEYQTMTIQGWHEVCRDVDGFGGTGVRFLPQPDDLQ
jgi:hypothetical protein